MEVKLRVTGKGWKCETKLGIWAVTSVDIWTFLQWWSLVTVEHIPVSYPHPGEGSGRSINRFPPVTGRDLHPDNPILSRCAQSGLRGLRTPSDAKNIRPVCLEVGRAEPTQGARMIMDTSAMSGLNLWLLICLGLGLW